MKKLFLLFFIFLVSCNSNRNEVTDIEIMSYTYTNEDNEVHVFPYFYATIDTTGFSNNIREMDSENSIGYSSSVDQNLINDILKLTRQKEEDYFIRKIDTNFAGCFLGPVIRFRVKYKNGKEISFNFSDKGYQTKSKYYLFGRLYEKLINSPKISLLNEKELNLIGKKQKDFEAFVFRRDTLELPLPPPPPPPPNLDEVKISKK